MTFKKGQRVSHPARPEWGLGEVREDAAIGRARVFFVNAGERIISLAHVALIPVDGTAAADPLLDNLPAHDAARQDDYQPLSVSIANFLRRYPGGFYGTKFMREERDYKVAAHKLCRQQLSKSRFGRLLSGHSYSDATRAALRVVNATNLIFPNEKMSLRDGLKDPGREQQFCEALFSLLHDAGTFQSRFSGFSRVLDDLQAAKWTIATYYQFLYDPDNSMFLKPVATQRAARTCRFDIHYKADLNLNSRDDR